MMKIIKLYKEYRIIIMLFLIDIFLALTLMGCASTQVRIDRMEERINILETRVNECISSSLLIREFRNGQGESPFEY